MAPVSGQERPRRVRVYKLGDRGFHTYGRPFACTYGTLVDVYESSSAEGPHVWLALQEGANLDNGRALAHLNKQQAKALIARLQTWLDEIPTRWGRR